MARRLEHSNTASRQGRRETRVAVLAIVASVAALSLGDALIKAAGLSLPLSQLFVLRSALVIPVLWWLARRRAAAAFSMSRWVLLRSAMFVAMWLSYYAALPLMALTSAAAAYYTGPLFVVLVSSLVARRWPEGPSIVAVAFGFAGVLLIVRPDPTSQDWVTFLPVVAALLYGCAMVITSARCREEDPIALALVLHLDFVFAGLGLGLFSGRDGSPIFGPWERLSVTLVATIVALAVLFVIGSVGAAIAYQKGPAPTVAAFDYSYLVFSVLWGVLLFSELPGPVGFSGLGLVVAGGLMALPWRAKGQPLDEP